MVFSFLLGLIAARLTAELYLNALNRRSVLANKDAAPASVAAIMDAESYQKSVAYTLAKNAFSRFELGFDAIILVVVLTSGLLPKLQALCGAAGEVPAWREALFLVATGVVLSIPGIPLEWWEQFRLEERFGFNKSSIGLWVMDKIKGALVGFAIGFPLLWALLGLVRWLGTWWWAWGFALVFVFQLTMLVLYPKVILPLFNKLTPLPAGELKDRLLALGERTGFSASTIEVIDGSKRSAHSNAYFTGFGRFRRIVLFDTLIQQLTPEELEAVLAHEVGHYKKGHIPKMLAVSAFMMLAAFGVIAFLIQAPWFNPTFGFAAGQAAPAFLLFGLLSGLATFWFTPVGNYFSRKHEYEADAFARAAVGGAGPMVGALRKLAQKNLSNLTPHPAFSSFYYSHPTLVERERALVTG